MRHDPPQLPPIDRRIPYQPDLKPFGDRTPAEGDAIVAVQHGPAKPLPAALGGPGDSPAGTTALPVLLDGPGGLFGAPPGDPAPWTCGARPTPGCLPPPPPVIGGRH
ncbi:hypothetical protein ACIRST_04535 [Kitasatospora sp. NPDC101447]|uniref:hypothetical protein n=1 Tax=Kitasatospora sp. NPDC101447 TaxID=3364102 RepID=UPI00380C8134